MVKPPNPQQTGRDDSPAAQRVVIVNLLPTTLLVLGGVVVWNFLGQVRGAVLLLALGALVAAALNPLVVWANQRLKLPRLAGAILSVVLLVLGMVLVLWLLVPSLVAQLSTFAQGLPGLLKNLEAQLKTWSDKVPTLTPLVQGDTISALGQMLSSRITALLTQTLSWTATMAGVLVSAILLMVLIIFILARPEPLVQGLLSAIPGPYRGRTQQVFETMLKGLAAWGRGLALMMLVVGVAMGLGLWLIGVKNWLLYGFLAALGEVVPTLGPILATLPPLLEVFTDNPAKALWVVVLAVGVQQMENHLLVPFVLGGSARMHPVSVVAGIVVFGSVFGLIGAFLTVPFLIIIKAAYEGFYLRKVEALAEAAAKEITNRPL